MKTSLEFVAQLTHGSHHGLVMQTFILAALDIYAQQVLMCERDPDAWSGATSWPVWQSCAKELKTELDAYFDNIVKKNLK